jgi:hypothetical protein
MDGSTNTFHDRLILGLIAARPGHVTEAQVYFEHALPIDPSSDELKTTSAELVTHRTAATPRRMPCNIVPCVNYSLMLPVSRPRAWEKVGRITNWAARRTSSSSGRRRGRAGLSRPDIEETEGHRLRILDLRCF